MDVEKEFDELFRRAKGNREEKTNDNDNDKIDISFEEWQAKLNEKRQNLKQVSDSNLSGLWDSLEFELSVFKILNIKDCTLPFAGILLGPPGALKTVGLQLFRKVANTFYTDNFSARAFVSHSTTVKKDALPDIDMLPRMKNHFFLTPELSPIFGKKDEDLQETLSIITRVLDGHGFESDTGAHGHRGYNEDIMFTWVGAAVEIPYKVHKYLGSRGAKLYFFRLPLIEKSDSEYMDQLSVDDFNIKTKIVQEALSDYLKWFDQCPEGININNLIKIQWNNEKDDKKTKEIILKLGKILAHLRAVVSTWEKTTSDIQGLEFVHAFATIEDPSRAMTQLRNLARGHALSLGRNYITIEDIPIVIKTVFSTASLERVRIFELLLESKGKLTTSEIVESFNISDDTAVRTMTELQAIGLVNVGSVQGTHGGEPQKQIKLVDKFDWFLGPEFILLRDSNSHSAEKPPCVLVNQNYNTLLLNSVLPRTDTHTTIFMRSGKCNSESVSNTNRSSFDENRAQKGASTILIPKTETQLKKCPECDYETEGFFLKVHLEHAHGIAQQLEIRDTVPTEYHPKAPAAWNGNVADLIKIKGTEIDKDQVVYDAYPVVGNFTLKNNFITGHLRLRGRDGGQYPYKYLEFINRVFDAALPSRTIEVCSNRIPGLNKCGNCFTVDINHQYKPDFVTDGQTLEGIKDDYFERWRCDPPYNGATAKEMYGTDLPSLYELLEAGARVIKPGSLMFLLCSQNVQSGTIGKGNIKRIGFIYISVVPNNETRILNIYLKLSEKEI
jgi:predicted DNA-binding transcriptional regulator